MTRDEARAHLEGGGELDGRVLTKDGRVVARGKIKWTGTVLLATERAHCTQLQLQLGGGKLLVPLVEGVTVRNGEDLRIEFGPTWRRQQRSA